MNVFHPQNIATTEPIAKKLEIDCAFSTAVLYCNVDATNHMACSFPGTSHFKLKRAQLMVC